MLFQRVLEYVTISITVDLINYANIQEKTVQQFIIYITYVIYIIQLYIS